MLRVALAISFALLACTSDASGPEGALEKALARTRPVARPGDTAAERPAPRVTSRLMLTLGSGQDAHTLEVARTLSRDGARYRLLDARTYRRPSAADPSVAVADEDAVEWLFDGTTLVWRHGEGPWIERDALDGLARRTLAKSDDLATFVLAAWGDYLARAPLPPDAAHPAEQLGRRLTWTRLSLDPAVRPIALSEAQLADLRARDATVATWLAASYRPSTIEGELAHDAAGALVHARFTVKGSVAMVDGARPFEAVVTREASDVPKGEADFTLPPERLPEARERPWLMIEDVLGDGLLPPYKPAK